MADKKNDKHITQDSSVQTDSLNDMPENDMPENDMPENDTPEAVAETVTDAEPVQDNITDSSQSEFFAADTPEQTQTESGDATLKTKKSLWSYVVMGLIVLALLLCGYIFNIFGLRSVNDIITPMTDSAVSGAKLDNKSEIKPAVPAVKSVDKPVSVQNLVSDVKTTDTEQKTQPKIAAVLVAESQKKQNPDVADVKNNNVTMPVLSSQAENITDKTETGKIETDKEEIVKTETYATNRTDYLKYRQSIKDLNQKIYAKQSYINELIAVKSIFPNVDLTVMTRYALTGTMDKFTLAKRGVRAVHRAAMLKETLPNDATLYDKASNIFKRLVVITADKNDTNQISGQLGLIKNAFQSGDFNMAQSLIDDLPPSHKTIFSDVMMSYADMRGVKSEMRVLDDALVDKLFATE